MFIKNFLTSNFLTLKSWLQTQIITDNEFFNFPIKFLSNHIRCVNPEIVKWGGKKKKKEKKSWYNNPTTNRKHFTRRQKSSIIKSPRHEERKRIKNFKGEIVKLPRESSSLSLSLPTPPSLTHITFIIVAKFLVLTALNY